MAVQAVRYTLPESDEIFDAMLKTTLIDMLLVMLQDSDTEIRRLAMSTLNSAARNKADLILPHLNELVPLVLSESVMKPELVKEVMLGPFRHTVDDGLEVRKVRDGGLAFSFSFLVFFPLCFTLPPFTPSSSSSFFF